MDIYILSFRKLGKPFLVASNVEWFQWNPDGRTFSVDTDKKSLIGRVNSQNSLMPFAPKINDPIYIQKWLSDKKVMYVAKKNKELYYGTSDLEGLELHELGIYNESLTISNNLKFLAKRYWDKNEKKDKLIISSIEGFKRIELSERDLYDGPVWSPDDNKIAYLKNQEGYYSIWIFNLGTKSTKKLIDLERDKNSEFGVSDIKWDVSGDKIYTVYNEAKFLKSKKSYLLTYNFMTNKVTIKNLGVAGADNIIWTKDSKKLYYTDKNRSRIYEIKID